MYEEEPYVLLGKPFLSSRDFVLWMNPRPKQIPDDNL